MKLSTVLLLSCIFAVSTAYVDYSGHKVLTVTPKSEKHLELLHELREKYSVDLWNEPRFVGAPVMTRLRPELIKPVEHLLKEQGLQYEVAYSNLQSAIEAERIQNAPTNFSRAEEYNFGKYHKYEVVVQLLKDLSEKYSTIAKLEVIGKSYENRPLYNMKISSGDSSAKPAILMECGIHAREWSSVAAGAYMVNKILTSYGSDSEITALVDKYEINIIVEINPDGYIFTWDQDRLWRKTRSRSSIDWLGVCRGADANRNFDIDHCGVGTSRKPCEEIYCGDKPFSESETRALRDMMIAKKDRLKVYFSIHAYSQYWMTPYGIKKTLPSNYDELIRVGKAGVDGLAKRYGTKFELGSIANIIYEAAGSSLDYIYEVLGVKMGFALELRDNGRFGFILPDKFILPMCEETWDGIKAAIEAL
ncbi:carboxypeptidase B isoform X1 [Parasteatoda tepidariorum]|uniref:carboxypeptidase B isoform X1 n=2 Tax=Parasteatoda tepidariorum TaxID=114398 RepID=UPI001C721DD5|nr:carboxypeptidase B isoform X1 [Parasteatoda tepidariorum]